MLMPFPPGEGRWGSLQAAAAVPRAAADTKELQLLHLCSAEWAAQDDPLLRSTRGLNKPMTP